MVYLLAILFIVGVYDLVNIYKIKKKIERFLYQASNPLMKFQIFIVLFLLLITASNVFLYTKTHSINYILGSFMLIIPIIQLSIHTLMKNGITEKGVVIWGQYFQWNEVIHYKITKNNILFLVKVNILGLKYCVIERCRVKDEEILDIEKFLAEHVIVLDTVNLSFIH